MLYRDDDIGEGKERERRRLVSEGWELVWLGFEKVIFDFDRHNKLQ